MKVHLPLMIQDPMTGGEKIVEGIHVESERDHVTDFGDGPTTSRVVVHDVDPITGEALPGVKFIPPGPRRKMGRYQIPDDDIYSHEFISASVLGAVLKTMRLFSDEYALGREITWAFDRPQLRVLPRAGEAANAFYDRESGSLQFFHFKNPHNPAQTVFTSLSRDIVAHETGHAIVDAIAPTLYDALTPQSLAVHEAIADLTALMTAFQSNTLRLRVLEQTRGSIRNPNAFSSLAPQFGRALDESGRAGALRSLWNHRTLDPEDRSLDEQGRPNLVDPTDPHALSEVLSGALYQVMVKMHESYWAAYGGEFSTSGRALAQALGAFQRIVFRALDYLPPGEASFSDYGRAICDGHMTSHITWGDESHWLAEEFQRRHIIEHSGEVQRLQVVSIGQDGQSEPAQLGRVERAPAAVVEGLEGVGEDPAEALGFVNKHRTLFAIPPRVPIKVYPTLRTRKTTGWGEWSGTDVQYEMLLKVSWEQVEEDYFDRHFPRARSVTSGTTIALNVDGYVSHVESTEVEAHRAERDRMVRSLLESGLLRRPSRDAGGSDPVGSPIRVDVRKGIMKISGAGRLLHHPAGRRSG